MLCAYFKVACVELLMYKCEKKISFSFSKAVIRARL